MHSMIVGQTAKIQSGSEAEVAKRHKGIGNLSVIHHAERVFVIPISLTIAVPISVSCSLRLGDATQGRFANSRLHEG